MAEALARFDRVTKRFIAKRDALLRPVSWVYAVDDISFDIVEGETLAIVGESGSGKTTIARLLTKLWDADAGTVSVNEALLEDGRSDGRGQVPLGGMKGARLRAFRRHVDMIFQDPYDAMDPRRNILDTVMEPLSIHRVGSRSERVGRVVESLRAVGLDARDMMYRLPHELSGGQRQRVAIARALVLTPRLVVADEPTSMLDVSVRAGVMKLLADLQSEMALTFVYVTHNLAVARHIATRIAVVYLGKVVEIGPAEEIIAHPLHPYTKALIAAVPEPGVALAPSEIGVPTTTAVDPAPRCRFYERCPIATERCAESPHPGLDEVGPGRSVACYNAS